MICGRIFISSINYRYYGRFNCTRKIKWLKHFYDEIILYNIKNNQNKFITDFVTFISNNKFDIDTPIKFYANNTNNKLKYISQLQTDGYPGSAEDYLPVLFQFNLVNQRRLFELLKFYLPYKRDFVKMSRNNWYDIIGPNYKAFQQILIQSKIGQREDDCFKLYLPKIQKIIENPCESYQEILRKKNKFTLKNTFNFSEKTIYRIKKPAFKAL